MKNKTVCFFNSNKVWGGGEKWYYDTALFFRKEGYKVLVATNKKSELFERIKKTGISAYQIKIGNLSLLNIFKIIKISRLLKTNNVDCIILNLPSDVKAAGIAAKIARVKKIIYRRGLAVPVRNTFINRFLFRKVITTIIANSKEIKRTILHYPELVPEDKICVIYNGIEPKNYNPVPGKKIYTKRSNEIVLGNVGRLVEQKGQKYLIEIARMLKEAGTNFKILIAGNGKLESVLKQLAARLEVNEHVQFIGFVKDIKTFIDSIDVFLLSSLHEGSANILIEVMAYQKPIVAFNISSNPEIIENGKTGFLVNFPDIKDFTEKTIFLMRNEKLREQFGKAGRVRVKNLFDQDRNLQELLELIK